MFLANPLSPGPQLLKIGAHMDLEKNLQNLDIYGAPGNRSSMEMMMMMMMTDDDDDNDEG